MTRARASSLVIALAAWAAGCKPCPHNKCAIPSLFVHISDASTGATLIRQSDPDGGSAFVTITQAGQTWALTPDNSWPTDADELASGLGAGAASIVASAPGYQSVEQDITVETADCGGVQIQSLGFALPPENSAVQPLKSAKAGGSNVCGG
ncbi:MAG: hypothetical protein JST54_09035 [Deltaproteobacteria bacterium]|nr:hypothetical protein [Deltaproteobacteria bacterium]